MKLIDARVQASLEEKVVREEAKKELKVCTSKLDAFEEQALSSFENM
jgi:hypothetical protein